MAGIVTAAAGLYAASKSGSGPKSTGFKPIGINAGGLRFSKKGKNIVGKSTQGRMGLITDTSSLFSKQAGELKNLRSLVAPGFSQYRNALRGVQESRLSRLGDERTRAVGDLRENLSRRRVLGSSFGQDALSRTRAEFQRQEDEVLADIGMQQAQTAFQELQATKQLMDDEFNSARSAVQVFIDNLNLEAEVATKLASGATTALSANAQVQQQMLQRQADNQLEVLGALPGYMTEVGSLFKPGGIFGG